MRVAVIDSGVNAQHPALAGRLGPGWDYTAWTAATPDEDGHGTHVAGTVLAETPAAVRVCPFKQFRGAAPLGFDWLTQCLDGARSYECRVANLSVIDPSRASPAARRPAVAAFPGVVVVAAGNQAEDLDRVPDWLEAWGDLPNVLVVAALDRVAGGLWSGSNWGARSVHVAAVGERVPGPGWHGGTTFRTGTSMACARVSAVVASLLVARPHLTPDRAVAAVRIGSIRLPALAGRTVAGWADLAEAVRAADRHFPRR